MTWVAAITPTVLKPSNVQSSRVFFNTKVLKRELALDSQPKYNVRLINEMSNSNDYPHIENHFKGFGVFK